MIGKFPTFTPSQLQTELSGNRFCLDSFAAVLHAAKMSNCLIRPNNDTVELITDTGEVRSLWTWNSATQKYEMARVFPV